MNNRTGMDGKTITAIAVGAGVGIIAFLVNHFVTRQERNRMKREISVLRRDVLTMKTELSTMKVTKDKECDTTDDSRKKSRRRRGVRREMSGYDSESTMYTAQDSDDEFFDLSSDEDGLVPKSAEEEDETQTFFNEIDTKIDLKISTLNVMLSRAEELGSNVNYLWRLAKTYKLEHDLCESGKDEKLRRIELGLNHARKAVELDACSGDAHKWLAVHLGLKTDFLATKEKLQNGMLFFKHVNRAIELKPGDHSLYYLLARFKFAIATLTWFERNAAKMIGELPEVTLDDAILDATRCEDLSPQPMPDNRLLLAKVYFANNDSSAGCEWLRKARDVCPVDGEAYKEIVQLYSKYQ